MTQYFLKSEKDGFKKLFEDSFNSFFDELCRYAFTYLQDRERAKDTVQVIFAKWWEKKDSILIQQTVRGYLYSAVYHHCLNAIRDDKVRKSYAENYKRTEAEAREFVDTVCYEEVDFKIRQTIESLPRQCHIIFCKSRFENMTYSQIATDLTISIKTVETQMTKALKILRGSISEIA
jgi:RNA polymerase sigma-70 factor, ECF subfamily